MDCGGPCAACVTCAPNLNLSDPESGTVTEQAVNYVTSSSKITGTANVVYHAGLFVNMAPGFEVSAGADYHAYILACSDSTLSLGEDSDTAELALDFKKTPNTDSALVQFNLPTDSKICLLYTSPSPRDQRGSRMPSSA